MGWREINRTMQRKKDSAKKACGNCKRFDKCRVTKDVEPWNFLPDCKDADYKAIKEPAQ